MNMLRTTLPILCLLATLGPLFGQDATALDYFNQASKAYVKQDKATALRTIDQGLRSHPGDARLLKLAEELIKEDDKQQQQDQQQQQQQQKQQDEQKKEQDKQQQNGEGEKKPDENGSEQNDKDGQRREPEQNNGGEQPEQATRQQPGTIAPQDARRMLDALERQEKDVQDKVRARLRPAQRKPIDKDW
jgi:Ca-activated chloride channel homolog